MKIVGLLLVATVAAAASASAQSASAQSVGSQAAGVQPAGMQSQPVAPATDGRIAAAQPADLQPQASTAPQQVLTVAADAKKPTAADVKQAPPKPLDVSGTDTSDKDSYKPDAGDADH